MTKTEMIPMRSDSFALQGYTYYAEQRTCSKPGCKCANGDLHGPYWYSRNQLGVVKYVGKTLPDELLQARAKRAQLETAIVERQKKLADEIGHLRAIHDALVRLRHNQDLNKDQIRIIEMLGFGDCLVPPGGAVRPQEGENHG